MTEAELLRGYRNADTLRRERCACGGYLEAPADDEERIRFAVQRHQRTSRHRAWWASR